MSVFQVARSIVSVSFQGDKLYQIPESQLVTIILSGLLGILVARYQSRFRKKKKEKISVLVLRLKLEDYELRLKLVQFCCFRPK